MNNRYTDGMLYEIFIKRAFGYNDRNSKNGADVSVFTNLVDAFNNKNSCFLPSYDKQFSAITGYLDNAIAKFLNRKPKLKEIELNALNQLKIRLQTASHMDTLVEIVNEGLTITQDYK